MGLLPCGCSLPNVAHHALERLGGVPESADTTVPAAFIRRRLAVPLWPSNKQKHTQGNTVFTRSHTHTQQRHVSGQYPPQLRSPGSNSSSLFMPLMVAETKQAIRHVRLCLAPNAELQTSYRAWFSQRC